MIGTTQVEFLIVLIWASWLIDYKHLLIRINIFAGKQIRLHPAIYCDGPFLSVYFVDDILRHEYARTKPPNTFTHLYVVGHSMYIC